MYPLTHFLVPFFFGGVFVEMGILSYWHALIMGLIGMFIDIDHLIEFILVKKEFSIRHAWNNSTVLHRFSGRTFIHHTFGFVLITLLCLVLFFFNWTYALMLGVAYYSHIILDYLHICFLNKQIKFREFGFSIRIPEYELLLDLILIVAIVVLWFI